MKKLYILVFLFLSVNSSRGQINVNIDLSQVGNPVSDKQIGICLSYPTDDDKYYNAGRGTRTHESVYRSMKVKTLRFPMGTLAENYLWTTPGTGNYSDGLIPGNLTPRVASKSHLPYLKDNLEACPTSGSRWSEFTNNDGTMVADASLDFDEFMTMAISLDADPVIMVNSFGHLLCSSEVDSAAMVNNARQWVRYAKRVYPGKVKYWEIGNEISSIIEDNANKYPTPITLQKYINIFTAMCNAMKAEDSTIKVGAGIGFSGPFNYFAQVLNGLNGKPGVQNIADFLVPHQYKGTSQVSSYSEYLALPTISLEYIKDANDAINGLTNTTNKSRIKILVTEFGSTPANEWADSTFNNIYKSFYELDMMLLALKTYGRVDKMHSWASHSPFSAKGKENTHSNVLDSSLNILPQGMVLQLFNSYRNGSMLNFTSSYSGGELQVYGMRNEATNQLSLFFINKSTASKQVNLNLSNYTGFYGGVSGRSYKSNSSNPLDTLPVITSDFAINDASANFLTTINPVSVKVITFDNVPKSTQNVFLVNGASNRRLYLPATATTVKHAPSTNTGDNVKWHLIPVASALGYYHIENPSSSKVIRPSNTGNSNVIPSPDSNVGIETQWKKVDNSDGSFRLESRWAPGYFLRVKYPSGSPDDFCEISTLTDLNTKWNFTLSGSSSLAANEMAMATLAPPVVEKFGPELVLYPNPVTDILNLTNIEENEVVKIIDMNGNKLIEVRGVQSINVSTIARGVYFVVIGDGKHLIKFIKN